MKDKLSDKKFKTREKLYDYLLKNYLNSKPINYIEFGVFQGESIKYWLENISNKDARFYGFDTFTGLPEH